MVVARPQKPKKIEHDVQSWTKAQGMTTFGDANAKNRVWVEGWEREWEPAGGAFPFGRRP